MTCVEQALVFPCQGEYLVGITAAPKSQEGRTGVLIAVGGPQYRAGSHRHFVLLSRALASAGFPTLRFDYRGMGDSSGASRSFEQVDDDFAAAIDAFRTTFPAVERLVFWGLCDAASAALLYLDARGDKRIKGLVILNPWVRSEATLAQTRIKHYYGQRLLSAEFWRKLLRGQLGIGRALREFVASLRSARSVGGAPGAGNQLPFQARMARAFSAFSGPSLLILSGNDYTAKEFCEAARNGDSWAAALARDTVHTVRLEDADHTFSTAEWRDTVAREVIEWLRQQFR